MKNVDGIFVGVKVTLRRKDIRNNITSLIRKLEQN